MRWIHDKNHKQILYNNTFNIEHCCTVLSTKYFIIKKFANLEKKYFCNKGTYFIWTYSNGTQHTDTRNIATIRERFATETRNLATLRLVSAVDRYCQPDQRIPRHLGEGKARDLYTNFINSTSKAVPVWPRARDWNVTPIAQLVPLSCSFGDFLKRTTYVLPFFTRSFNTLWEICQ
jgi:hypothetical protein